MERSDPGMARSVDSNFPFGALGIARESARVILKYSSFFTAIAAVLIYPASAALFLSHPVLGRHLVGNLVIRIQAIARASGFPQTRLTELIYLKLSQAISSYIFCFPFTATFLLLGKASATHTVAYAYAGYRPSSQRLFGALPGIWKRLVVTYSWICLLVLGSNAAVLLFLLVSINVLGVLGFSSNWVICSALLVGILYSLVFAHVAVVCNLATVVCVVEDCCGFKAVYRAKSAIHGRTRTALLISLITTLSSACVEGLFQYRTMTIPRSSVSLLWEGPLLIFMYSLVGLMDAVMNCVFYHTCNIPCRWDRRPGNSSSEYEPFACDPSGAK